MLFDWRLMPEPGAAGSWGRDDRTGLRRNGVHPPPPFADVAALTLAQMVLHWFGGFGAGFIPPDDGCRTGPTRSPPAPGRARAHGCRAAVTRGEREAEVQHEGLGRAIDGEVRRRLEGGCGRNVDHRSTAALEQVNATMSQLKRYWAKIRESGDPEESPRRRRARPESSRCTESDPTMDEGCLDLAVRRSSVRCHVSGRAQPSSRSRRSADGGGPCSSGL